MYLVETSELVTRAFILCKVVGTNSSWVDLTTQQQTRGLDILNQLLSYYQNLSALTPYFKKITVTTSASIIEIGEFVTPATGKEVIVDRPLNHIISMSSNWSGNISNVFVFSGPASTFYEYHTQDSSLKPIAAYWFDYEENVDNGGKTVIEFIPKPQGLITYDIWGVPFLKDSYVGDDNIKGRIAKWLQYELASDLADLYDQSVYWRSSGNEGKLKELRNVLNEQHTKTKARSVSGLFGFTNTRGWDGVSIGD